MKVGRMQGREEVIAARMLNNGGGGVIAGSICKQVMPSPSPGDLSTLPLFVFTLIEYLLCLEP